MLPEEFVGGLGCAVEGGELGGREGRQPQPHAVVHIDAFRFDDDQESETVVLAIARGQAQPHVAQEVHGAVHPDADLVGFFEEDHGLRDQVAVETVQDRVDLVHGLQ